MVKSVHFRADSVVKPVQVRADSVGKPVQVRADSVGMPVQVRADSVVKSVLSCEYKRAEPTQQANTLLCKIKIKMS